MGKHTLGAWEVATIQEKLSKYNYSIFSLAYNNDMGAKTIADIYVKLWKKGQVKNDKEAEANARLIAAAPELLEACKRAYNHLLTRPARKDEGNLMVTLQQTIAKAEGK